MDFAECRLGKTGTPPGARRRSRLCHDPLGEFTVRSITGIKARLALAALFVTSLAGLAAADGTTPTGFDLAGARSADRGPAPTAEKIAPSLDLRQAPSMPEALTSSQYPTEVEPNGTAATATPISGTSSAREGNIFIAGDVDFWSFSGQAGDRVYAATMTSLSSNASVDSVLDLIGPDGTTVIETDLDDGSFGATSSSIAGATLPAAGTYYLRVRHNAAATHLRPYRLFLQVRSGAPTAETEPNDTFPGQALPAGGWVTGSTSATTDADFYSLNLNAGDTVFISADLDPERDATEWNAQVGLGAFGVPPLVLVVNDAGSATPDSEVFFTTVNAAGTYGVLVGLPTGGATFGTYHLNVTVFPKIDDGVNCTTYTSTNVPVVIADGPSIQTSTLTIPGNPRIEDLDVEVNITHNFMADLDVQLTAPGGNTVGLFSDIGSVTAGAQTTMNTTFNDESAVPSLFTVVNGNSIAPELNYRLSWFDGQPAGGTWTMTLRDDATGDGGTLNSWSLRVCEAPPPPACAPGFESVTVLSTDFESGAAGFTHSGTLDEWELGNPTFIPVTGCNSGTNCWKTDLDNSYENSSNQELLSPAINLAGLSPPVVVNWAHKYQLEPAQFDTFAVELRQVGVPASAVNLFQHLGADMQETVGNPGVVIPEAAGWGQVSARADALAGQNVEFAVRLTTDTTVQRAGVAIDDFSVTACRVAEADLSITKTDGVATATPGGSTTYTITASNAGPAAVTGGTVADTFPASLTCTWTCAGAGGGTCTAAGSGNINDVVNLPSGGSVTYTASCAIAASATGTLVNTATVSSSVTDPTPGNNSATDTDTLTPQGDLAITKTDGVTTATPGGSVTYTITSSNAGPSDATGATVADTFPASLTCTWTCVGAGGGTCTASGSGNINDTVNLPAGGSTTHTAICTVSPAATGSLSNTATVAAPAGVVDPTPGNNSATDTDTLNASADLSITKTDGVTSATPGGSVTYTITGSNAGPSNATGATIVDTFPASLTCTWTCAGAGGGSCTASGSGNINDTVNLPSGGSVTYTAICGISGSATGTLINTATVAAPAGVTDPTPGNNSATDTDTLTPSADVSITKTDGVTTVTAGGSTTYTITASNAGPSPASGNTVSDTFPASLTCTWTCAGSGGGTCTAAGSGNIADPVNLPAGASVSYTAVCSISGSASGSIVNTATVEAGAGAVDPNPANNSATDTDGVGTAADLAITKTDGVTNVTPGGSTTYTIVASNAGPSSASGVSVTDTFPAGLTCTWTCGGAGGGTCAAAGSGNIADVIVLPAGGSATYTAICAIATSVSGTLVNTATVSSAVTDPDPANNSATDTDTADPSADLSITKTDGVTAIAPGGTLTYTIVASNAGPSPVTGANVVDAFPAACVAVSWTCSASGGGACPASGSGGITAGVDLPPGAAATFTALCTVDPASLNGTVISNTATINALAGTVEIDPSNNSATDTTTVNATGAIVTATKTVSGSQAQGRDVGYTIVLANTGTTQNDNPGDEFTDVLPPQLTLVSATANSGTAVANVGTNTVTWNGAIPAGGSVTITIAAQVSITATGTISNQGTVNYDGDADGVNESSSLTDDPSVSGAGNATVFGVQLIVPVPGLTVPGMLLLALGLWFIAARTRTRRVIRR
jgi:uncharacterized repeat protein (TIGR01451 family)